MCKKPKIFAFYGEKCWKIWNIFDWVFDYFPHLGSREFEAQGLPGGGEFDLNWVRWRI